MHRLHRRARRSTSSRPRRLPQKRRPTPLQRRRLSLPEPPGSRPARHICSALLQDPHTALVFFFIGTQHKLKQTGPAADFDVRRLWAFLALNSHYDGSVCMTHRVSRTGMSHLTVETECAEVPAESLIDSIQKIDDIAREACRNRWPRGSLRVKVLTWNVWFDTHSEFDLRLQSLVTQLLAASPCVAGLQEVTPSFVVIVLQKEAIF
jgi:hypothetical protein